jgi:hypothetical protein
MERTLSSKELGVKRGEDQNRSTPGQTEMQMDYQGRRGMISETNYFLGGMSQVGNKTSNHTD